jgi:two-component system LytT family sensor kinase
MLRNWRAHLLFWLGYTLVYAYLNTAFPQPSDLAYEWLARFGRFWRNEILMLPIKLVATYGFLSLILPRLWLRGKYAQTVLSSIGLLLLCALLSRWMTYHVLYPITYGEYPNFEMLSVRRVLYSALDVLSAVGLMTTMMLLQRRRESQIRESQLEAEKLAAELALLKSQIHPHFLFNTLNNLYGLARKGSEQTAPVILKLSQLLRFMLYECNQPQIPIQQEWDIIQDYLELERLRYGDRLHIEQAVDLQQSDFLIAPLLLLPLVENAFTHGLSESRFEGKIRLELQVREDRLRFQLINSKSEEPSEKETGIGLSNLRRQLNLLYPQQHQLDIEDRGSEFVVCLLLSPQPSLPHESAPLSDR